MAHWSRCEAALIGSRITVAASDREGRYSWIFNAPAELPADLVGKLDREVLPAAAASDARRRQGGGACKRRAAAVRARAQRRARPALVQRQRPAALRARAA